MNEIKNKKNTIDNSFYIISGIAIFSVIGLWFLTLFLLKDIGKEERGTFGDMFGSINALYSGPAFAGIIITILLQRKELELQRKELIQTRKELKRTAEAQEKSERALVRQANNLKQSAKLNALSTMIEYYNNQEIMAQRDGNINYRNKVRVEREPYMEKLKLILEIKD